MQSSAGTPVVGNVLQQLQLTGAGSLVTIGGPTVVAGGSTITSGSSLAAGAGSALSPPIYSYKVKIINPAKKSDVSVRYLNNHSTKFESTCKTYQSLSSGSTKYSRLQCQLLRGEPAVETMVGGFR